MDFRKSLHCSRGLILLIAALASCASAVYAQGAAQQPDSQQQAADSVTSLQHQVKELQTALVEMRGEIEQSRAEARALRTDLESIRQTTAELRAEVSPSQTAAASGPSTTGATPASNPAIEQRVAQLEENQQLLTDKVDQQYQTKVESGSKYRVRFSGIVLTNLYSNSAAVDNADIPSLAVSSSLPGTNGSVGATLRQSELGFDVTGPELWGAKTRADVQFDFAGGFSQTGNGFADGLVRLRTATIHMDWENTSLLVGQDSLFFVPNQPTSLASLAIPALAYAGNLWTWTPQVAVKHDFDTGDVGTFTVQGGVLDAYDGEPPYDQFYRSPSAGESSRQPAYAARAGWSRPAYGHTLRFGASGYYTRQNWGFSRNVDGWAGLADAAIPLPGRFELTGEFYRGKAVGGLGGGVGQTVIQSGATTDPTTVVQGLNSAGGWGQLKFRATEKLEFNAAYGLDSPFSGQLREFPGWGDYNSSSVARNRQYFANFIYRPRSNLLFSTEYRQIHTIYFPEDRYTANVINMSMGVLF